MISFSRLKPSLGRSRRRWGSEKVAFVLIEPGYFAKIAKIGDASDDEADHLQRY
jgi:hypothetical protein